MPAAAAVMVAVGGMFVRDRQGRRVAGRRAEGVGHHGAEHARRCRTRPTDAMVKLAEVAPAMLAPLRCHWKLSGAVPLAATVKVTDWPTCTVWLCGWVVICGGWLAAAGLIAADGCRRRAPGSRARRPAHLQIDRARNAGGEVARPFRRPDRTRG